MVKVTVFSLLAEKTALEAKIRLLNNSIKENMFSEEITAIFLDPISSQTDAERLAFQISERDWPMTRKEIQNVFETSGIEYNESHINLSNPDSDSATKEYRNEMDEQYRSVYGDSK